jgi:hypothetical protein
MKRVITHYSSFGDNEGTVDTFKEIEQTWNRIQRSESGQLAGRQVRRILIGAFIAVAMPTIPFFFFFFFFFLVLLGDVNTQTDHDQLYLFVAINKHHRYLHLSLYLSLYLTL